MEVISSINLFLSVFYLSLLQQVFLIYHMLQSKHVCRWLTEIPCYVRTFNINDMSNSLGSFHEFFFVWYDILKCQAQYFLILLVNVTYFLSQTISSFWAFDDGFILYTLQRCAISEIMIAFMSIFQGPYFFSF